MSLPKKLLLGAAIAGALLSVSAALVSRSTRPRVRSVPAQRVRVERRDVTRTLRLTGKVKPRSTTEVKSPVSGRLVRFLVAEGATVHAGDPLAIVEPDQSQSLMLGQATTDLQIKLLALEDAEHQMKRAEKLSAGGLIAPADFDRLSVSYRTAKQAAELARGQLQVLEQQTPMGGHAFQLVAPASGILLEPLVTGGETIVAGTTGLGSGGTVVTKIADLSVLLVRVQISEVDVLSAKPGGLALIQPAGMTRKLRGHLAQIGVEGTTQQNVTSYRGDIIVDEPAGLLPEMTADVDLIVAQRKSVVAVPTGAVLRGATGQAFVFKAGASNPSPVTTGLEGDDYVEIVDGLSPGDVIQIAPPSGAKQASE